MFYDLDQDIDGDFSILTNTLAEFLGHEPDTFDMFFLDGSAYQVTGHAGDYTILTPIDASEVLL